MIDETKKPIGYIPNARDFTSADPTRSAEVTSRDLQDLRDLGIDAEILDLQNFFENTKKLEEKINELGGIFISGGNTFVLRQAMKISGLDTLLTDKIKNRKDFVYAGYSAAGCVLAPNMSCYSIVDDPSDNPYKECTATIWEGLGLVDWAFMPHYKSNHEESADIDEEISLCEDKGIPYKPLRDGDVLIIDE